MRKGPVTASSRRATRLMARTRSVSRLTSVVLASIAVMNVFVASGVDAQSAASRSATRSASRSDRARIFAANVVVGGGVAVLGRLISGRSIRKGLLPGATGGALVFAGKEITSREGSLAAWSGREVAAVGSSMISAAAKGNPVGSDITLPLGPLRIRVDARREMRIRPKVDIGSLVVAGWVASKDGNTLDLGESVSHGAIIMTRRWGNQTSASTRGGVILMDDIPRDLPRTGRYHVRSGVIAHEMIHVEQYDFVLKTLGEPLDRMFARWLGLGETTTKYFDLGSAVLVIGLSNGLIPHRARPWEREAHSLAPGT